MWLNLLILLILLLLSGFFSGAEVALLSVTDVKVRTYLKENRKGSRALCKLKESPRRMIIIILIGNNVVNVSAASITAIIAAEHFGSGGLGLATGFLTLLILVFGEITPKTFANKNSGAISLLISRPIYYFGMVIYPVVLFLEWITGLMHRLVKVPDQELITEAEIKEMIQFGVEKQVIEPEEQYIINKALRFSDTSAKEVMVPFKNVFSLHGGKRISQAMGKIIVSGFSRVPIYKADKRNIIGIAMVKDIARELSKNKGNTQLEDVAKTPIYINESLRIDYLFKIFQKKHVHIAVVINKEKKAVGIATLEDLLEELVGEIEDESDLRARRGEAAHTR
ncbi:hemolysin family protein [Patescibacteria group bacterium]|nr:hemolysin family protein [Patescibacteria group bacterium]